MTVERSGLGALTTNAAEFYNDYESFTNASVNSGQWTIENNQIISYSWSFYPPATAPYDSRVLQSINFVGTTTNNDELEFGLIVRNYNTNVAYSETSYYPTNTNLPIYDTRQFVGASPATAYTIYVRRVDGGILTPSSMETSLIQGRWIFRQVLQQTTAIPENWLETTTASFQNPMDTYTTLIPTDYDISSSQYDPLLEIPSKIDTAINFIILGFGRIMNFRYISFVVCFVLIVGLVAWLIH